MTNHEASRTGGNEEVLIRRFNRAYSTVICEKIFIPPETAVLLAAYACQAKFGSAKSIGDPKLPVNDLLPRSTLDNHDLTLAEWENRISAWHLKLVNVSVLDAIVEYLNIAQDVELYGASIFHVETESRQRQLISLDAVGLNIYESKRKPPTLRYVWSDLVSLTGNGERIDIVIANDPDKKLVFFLAKKSTCELFVDLYHGSRQLYTHRKKIDPSSKYITRSESNSSVRMRPHALSKSELVTIRQIITEMQFEIPRESMNFEFAPWQVKSQLRLIRGIETKLSLNLPPTSESLKLKKMAATIREFLEKDEFKTKDEDEALLHHYRGNFAIRIGGNTCCNEEYSSDVDSVTDEKTSKNEWRATTQKKEITNSGNSDLRSTTQEKDFSIGGNSLWKASSPEKGISNAVRKIHPDHSMDGEIMQTSEKNMFKAGALNIDISENSSNFSAPVFPAHEMDATYVQPSKDSSPWGNANRFENSETSSNHSGAVVNQSPTLDDQTLNMVTPISQLPYSTDLDKDFNKPTLSGKSSFTMPSLPPSQWHQGLRSNPPNNQFAYGYGSKHGKLLNDEPIPAPFRPVLQPKPKVGPRVVGLPLTVTSDRDDTHDFSGRRSDLKFSSIQKIQKGFAKKRVDLFEAL